MAATNPADLSAVAAKVFVARVPSTLPELAYDLSNAGAIITAVEALTKHRMASVTDVNLTVGVGDTVQTDTDDNGTIFKAVSPTSTLNGNWFEARNADVLKDVLGIKVIDDTIGERTIIGQKSASFEVPRIVIVLETIPTPDKPIVEKLYIIDAGLTSDIVLNYLDVVRAGGVGNTPFTFTVNKNGGRFKVVPNPEE
ncbi:MAG: hypothetical protein LBG59_07905 [Candidatus Peribacteria bacterium]|jgi:phosphohistidine swiveling domain-containing protein|nr:hypothetical protein [Candidatus Peribacteria bacterium]